ncbi:MAG TPA: efflux RND transporter permease subunit [Candidatus Dormibacteraeota bacterium]|nr:efflux RND transporter permease subunit [Candidatus Dormibacteraeota bacterium]
MIRHIVDVCLKFRVLVLGAVVVVTAVGAVQLRDASVEPYPEFAPPQVQVRTESLGLSAAEVEQLITVPLERDLLNGVAWLDQIRSESLPGLSSIDLIFKRGTDLEKARQLVLENLSTTRGVPNFGNPPVMIQPLSSTSRVMMIGLTAKDLSLVDMSILARWKIKPKLMGLPGVANVAIWGQRDRQLQVQVDPVRLSQHGVTLDQVITTTGNALWVSPLTFVQASTPGTGGFIDTSTQRFEIQHVLPFTTAQGLSSVTVEGTGGTLRLSDVSDVVEGHQPLIGDAVISGGPGLMLVVQRFPDANPHDVTRAVEDAIDQLRPGLSGIQIDTNVYRAQNLVDATIHSLTVWGIAAGAALLLLLVLVLWSWRLVLVSAGTILLSLLIATYVLYLRGASFNVMVVAGMTVALAVVIDDAVAGVGNMRRRLHEHRLSGDTSTTTASIVADVSAAVRGPLGYVTLALLLAPLPLLFLDGVPGAFAQPAILSYSVAIAASFVVALIVAPVLAFLLLRGESLSPRTSPLAAVARHLYDRAAVSFLRRPRWAFASVLALLAITGAVAPQLSGAKVLPTPQDRNVLVNWEATPGTSLPEMDRVTTRAAQELRSLPGVRDVGAHIGRAITSDQTVNVNSGQLWVSLTDSAPFGSTVNQIAHVMSLYPGLRSDVLTYPEDQVNAIKTGSAKPLVVRVYGIDLAVMRTAAQQLRNLVASVDGVVQPTVQNLAEQPTLEVEVNLDTAKRYGLKPGDIRRAAATFFSGLPVGSIYQEQKIFDVVVWGTPGTRSAPATVSDLLIDAPTGGQVRLGDVANVRVAPYPTAITHDATFRSLDITADVQGRDIGAVLDDVRNRVRNVSMPLEYRAEVLSDVTAQQDQNRRTIGLAIAALLGAFLLLQAAFSSWRVAALVLVTLPLAGVGGVVGAYIAGGTMSLGALIGFFAVIGLAARNATLLVRSYQNLESIGHVARDPGVVLLGARKRLGSVLLANAAVAAVMIPLLWLGNAAGTEVLHPMAPVVIGGLVTSTLYTLFILPALYLRLSPSRWRVRSDNAATELD